MLMSTVSRVVSAWFAFLLPCYATFKALARGPLSQGEIQKWAMYWLPFYWELKTAFLLFISLPQTQGSTYIYNAYLQPFLARNEENFDAGIVAIHRNVLTFVQEKLTALWELLWSLSAKQRPQSGTQSAAPQNAPPLSWLFSNDVVRTALNTLHTTATSQSRPGDLASSRENSNSGYVSSSSTRSEVTQQTPPFPVPQHYHAE
ncbi:unnamed protein product [Cyclocybe aegerita]|uniref:Protein YOP1 n=1 Tax=Cyclocybe aegerita TaxID=1973307 RepID=A0A8S0WQ60_CYCAE|nr:unnamed protein product [Cyclocybe aegerita]